VSQHATTCTEFPVNDLEVDLPRLLALPDGVRRLAAGDERDVWATVRRKERVWSPVLMASFPPGHPIRAQLLDGTLGLLLGDVDPAEASTYHRFLDALKPTVEEIAARRRQYVALARHRVPALVSLAVKSLTRLDRKQPLLAEEIVGGLAPALSASSKATAKGAVALIDAATAIMRLAPWGRAAALAEAVGLPGPLARAIRAACGSENDLTGLPTPVANAVGWLGGQPHEGPRYLFGGEGEPHCS
jgi:hypothetical protein